MFKYSHVVYGVFSKNRFIKIMNMFEGNAIIEFSATMITVTVRRSVTTN